MGGLPVDSGAQSAISSGMMRISKKGIEPSSLDYSQVNLMLLSMEFM